MRRKGKRIKGVDEEIRLPEEAIQHIQSFMTGKEAARSTILSKSWYAAWLTRPAIDFDDNDFRRCGRERADVFEEVVQKTMQRYLDSNLNIEKFRLRSHICCSWVHNLIVSAMKIGATDVELVLSFSFTVPQEVLGSESLLRLSLTGCKVDENYVINCSRLKSLTLINGIDTCMGNVLKRITSCCISMEELSLSGCYYDLPLERIINPLDLHKLRRLDLQRVRIGSMFSGNFTSKFPCLKDLTVLYCSGCTRIYIASTSLETISFWTNYRRLEVWPLEMATFYVPNIRKFTYSGFALPSHLSIDGALREWELDLFIVSNRFQKGTWFINLKKLLKKFWLSRISLSIQFCLARDSTVHEADPKVVPKPLVVENLTINAPPAYYRALMVRSLGAFRPKFITHPRDCYYVWILDEVKSVYMFRKRLIHELFVSNWEDVFRQFGLKKVNAEIYDMFNREWRPPMLKIAKADSKAKVRLQLIWED